MLRRVTDRVRDRRLGSDARAGRRVRGEIRRTQLAYVRRNWRFLATGAAVAAVCLAVVAYVMPSEFLRGAVIGAGVVFVPGGLAYTVVLLTGTGPLTMGAVAETWTSSELRWLRKHGWKLVDHVFYRGADIDHLVLGPGGVIAVETKWSAEAWTPNEPNPRLQDAV